MLAISFLLRYIVEALLENDVVTFYSKFSADMEHTGAPSD